MALRCNLKHSITLSDGVKATEIDLVTTTNPKRSIICFVLLFCIALVYAQPKSHQKILKTPLGVPYQGNDITLNKRFLSTSNIKFESHPAGNYSWLGMTFNPKYIKPVFDKLNSTETPLITRGEAHITVISPPEFELLSNTGITLQDIDKIAIQSNIQSSKVIVVCLGRENLYLNSRDNIVYQIIVKAPNLVHIRQKIFKLYIEKGGNGALFDPNAYWPHITVGYTSNDLFIQNGVYKGSNVCYSRIHLK